MPRRQRAADANKREETPAPLNRIAYLVHIAAFCIGSWQDAFHFAAINRSSRECVECYLWPETAAAIVSDEGDTSRDSSSGRDDDSSSSSSSSASAAKKKPSFAQMLCASEFWPDPDRNTLGGWLSCHSPA